MNGEWRPVVRAYCRLLRGDHSADLREAKRRLELRRPTDLSQEVDPFKEEGDLFSISTTAPIANRAALIACSNLLSAHRTAKATLQTLSSR